MPTKGNSMVDHLASEQPIALSDQEIAMRYNVTGNGRADRGASSHWRPNAQTAMAGGGHGSRRRVYMFIV
jgi:hypothetical protein